MNLLFFLTPKRELAFVYEDFTVGQALQVMERYRYTAIPVLCRSGEYVGTLTEGDLLWGIRNRLGQDMKTAEKEPLAKLPRHTHNQAVFAATNFSEVMARALEQNFVPVCDDRGMFIGIVTRKRILAYLYQHMDDPEPDQEGLLAAVKEAVS
ncbi:MAG: CBS domain-containing protein [Clostridiaceae bacterium]|nr:CBS domain-containing protein [Clostridiaceae bacterium]